MKRRNILIFGLVSAMIFAAVTACQKTFQSTPLTVHLRCGENINGTLSMEIESGKQIFDAAEVCRSGAVNVGNYKQGSEAHFTFENKNGGRGDVISKYDADIQSDPQSFHVIIKITNEPPFIINEKL